MYRIVGVYVADGRSGELLRKFEPGFLRSFAYRAYIFARDDSFRAAVNR